MRYFKFLFLFLLLSFSNCASFQNYLSNRALDFTDILTLGGEVNTYGGSALVMVFWGWGTNWSIWRWLWNAQWLCWLLSHGEVKLGELKMGNSFLLMNSQEHLPKAYQTKRSMNKKYTHANFLFLLPANLHGRSRYIHQLIDYLFYVKHHLILKPSFGLGIGGRVRIKFC
ncbi:MAG: hypothetical protein IPG24_16365 [Leptospiraceae bacterium]|nr:hypothetical protein [Leptospiraceae bacterium]